MSEVDPTSSCAQKLSLSSSHPWMSVFQAAAPVHMSPQGCSPTAVTGTDHCKCVQSCLGLLWSLQLPSCALAPKDIQMLSYPEVALQDPQTHPGPHPTSLLTGSSGITFASITPTLAPVAAPFITHTHTPPHIHKE